MYMDGPWATNTYKQANFTGYTTEPIPAVPVDRFRWSVARTWSLLRVEERADTIKFVKYLQSPFANWQWPALVT